MEERENTVREERKKEMEVTTIDSVDPREFSVRLNKKKLENLPRGNTLIVLYVYSLPVKKKTHI